MLVLCHSTCDGSLCRGFISLCPRIWRRYNETWGFGTLCPEAARSMGTHVIVSVLKERELPCHTILCWKEKHEVRGRGSRWPFISRECAISKGKTVDISTHSDWGNPHNSSSLGKSFVGTHRHTCAYIHQCARYGGTRLMSMPAKVDDTSSGHRKIWV